MSTTIDFYDLHPSWSIWTQIQTLTTCQSQNSPKAQWRLKFQPFVRSQCSLSTLGHRKIFKSAIIYHSSIPPSLKWHPTTRAPNMNGNHMRPMIWCSGWLVIQWQRISSIRPYLQVVVDDHRSKGNTEVFSCAEILCTKTFQEFGIMKSMTYAICPDQVDLQNKHSISLQVSWSSTTATRAGTSTTNWWVLNWEAPTYTVHTPWASDSSIGQRLQYIISVGEIQYQHHRLGLLYGTRGEQITTLCEGWV